MARDIRNRIVPMVSDESEGGGRAYDIYSRLLRDRIIFLHGEIEETSASTIVMQLLILESENSEKPIYIYINSPGGCVYSCLSIIDTMKCLKCPIYTVGLGLVASAASVVLACGTKGFRYCLPNTRVMVHQPHGKTGGQVSDIEIQTNEFLFLKKKLTEIMSSRSKTSVEDMRELMERDKYLSSMEALTIGFIDEILEGEWDKKSNKSKDLFR